MQQDGPMIAAEGVANEFAEHTGDALGLDATAWVGIAFAIFIILFIKYAWPKMALALDGKSLQIRNQLEEAANLKEEAQAILADAERKSAEASQAAIDMMETAKADAKQMIVNAEKEIEKEIEEKLVFADKKIRRAEKLAIENVRDKAVDAAIDAATVMIEKELSKGSKKDALVKDSLKVISSKVS